MVVINYSTLPGFSPAQAKEMASLYAKRSKSVSVQAKVTGSPKVPDVVM